MKRVIIAVLLIACIATPAAWAATEAGASEIQLGGSYSVSQIYVDGEKDDDSEMTTISGQLVLNKFIASAWSVGLATRIDSTESSSGDTFSTVFLLGRTDIYLAPGADVTPYFGAHGGIISLLLESDDGEKTDFSVVTFGAQAGFKIFTSESTSWNIEADLSIYQPEDDEDSDTDVFTAVGTIFVGMSYYF